MQTGKGLRSNMMENTKDEIWKPIKGYEGLYEVSNQGMVKSLERLRVAEHIVAQFTNHRGYQRVTLWKNNKSKKYSVHRLVASAFVEKQDNKDQVNHIDENKQNNCASNLEWVTQLENHNHGTINERISKSLLNNPKLSKTVKAYNDNGKCVGVFPSANEASRQAGINISCIRDCLHKRNRAKHAGGLIWKFAD